MVKSDNYIVIQGWMVTDLQLSGNDLLVYAIINGFSQDKESKFTGSLQYLADWCGATKQGIQKNLKNLIERGLIEKNEVYKNGVKFCEYSCIPCNSVVHPMQQSCTNNIDNNIDNKEYNLSKDKLYETREVEKEISDYESHGYSKEDFLGSRKKVARPRGKSLYSKCSDEIMLYTQDLQLATLLNQYLSLRLAMKDKPIYGVNQWKGLLDKLSKVIEENPGMSYEDVVKQSIERGYASFFPVSSNKKKDISVVASEYGEVTCKRANEEDIVDEEF